MKNSFILLICLATSALRAQVTIVKSPLYMYDYVATVNDKLLFFATDALDANYELWASDGTTAGTQQLKDIIPGTDGSILDASYWGPQYTDREPVVYKNELYFLAFDPDHGMEIWKSDGTESGTKMLKDIFPGGLGYFSPSFNYPYFTEMDGILYFAANDGTHGFELWKTDGTEAGTEMVKDISTDDIYGSNPEHLIVYHDKLYFTARDDVYGYEIYKSDGTSAGTMIVKDIVPGIDGSMNDGFSGSIDPQFTVSGDYLYFTGRIDAGPSLHLFRTDGTEAGTITLYNDLESIAQLTDINGICFFYAFDGDYDHSGLWKTDGSPSGTVNIETDGILAFNNYYNFNNTLYFSGGETDLSNIGLYKSDGTSAGTELVKAYEGLASFPEVGDYIAEEGSITFFYRALFKITESSMNWRYVQTNGTTAGTKIFWDASPFRGAAFYDGKLYFSGIDTIGDEWALYSLTPEDMPSEINTFLPQDQLHIYPNPAEDNIVINLPMALQNAVVQIKSMSGVTLQNVFTGNTAEINININNLNNGLYILNVIQEGVTYSNKLMVLH